MAGPWHWVRRWVGAVRRNVHGARLVAIIMGALLFWPFHAVYALRSLPDPVLTGTPTLALLWPPTVLTSAVSLFLFSRLGVYLAISVVGLGVGILGLRRPRARPVTWALTLLAVLSIVALPWSHRYQPAVGASAGVEVRTVNPVGPLGGVARTFQAIAELQPAEYRLLGWHATDLYYQEMTDTEWQTWRYEPDGDSAPTPVPGSPGPLDGERLSRLDAAERVGASPALLAEASYLSPDGQWLAVVSKHLYGPQDVLLLKAR